MFYPLQSPPKITVEEEPDDLDLSEFGLDPEVAAKIQEKSLAKTRTNRAHFKQALAISNGHFADLYGYFARFTNCTSDSACVFMKFHSVNDIYQCRLVRSKMANIFKPVFRRHLL